ncbi:site-specific integrase, partial [bacterium]|nr:site-specific integrase [bacterium]
IVFNRDGKVIEEKAGRQYADRMTPAKANRYRSDRIEGRQKSRKEIRESRQAAKKAEAKRFTIAKLWDLYTETYPGNKGLKNEKLKFERYLRSGIGKKEPSALMPMDVDRLRLKLQKKGKRTMAARVLELLRRTINFGVKRGSVDPIRFKIKIPKLNNQTTEDLAPEQIKKLIEVLDADIDQTAANVMRLALFSGMRRSEIFKLKWVDLDFRRGFITLVDPKGGKDQIIPMNDTARGIFESIYKRNDFVFPGRFPGQHLTDCRKSFARIAKAAGFPKGFRPLYGLRHVYASMLASSGQVDMYTLQKLLTHKSPLMTQRYVHLRDDTLKRASGLAVSIIEEAVGTKESEKKIVNLEDHS